MAEYSPYENPTLLALAIQNLLRDKVEDIIVEHLRPHLRDLREQAIKDLTVSVESELSLQEKERALKIILDDRRGDSG